MFLNLCFKGEYIRTLPGIYLEIIHRWCSTLGCAPAVPLVQRVTGLRAQHTSCLVLLEVLDERHCPICTGQVIASYNQIRNIGTLKKVSDKMVQ